jgi:G2/mitotic-specific cyclin 1/2
LKTKKKVVKASIPPRRTRSSSRHKSTDEEEDANPKDQEKAKQVEARKKNTHTNVVNEVLPTKKVKVDYDDLDADDATDPMMVSEYVIEIFDYLRELEVFYG